MMLIEDVEEFEEAFCEELEKKFLKTHSVDELLEICLETNEEFCLMRNQEGVN